MLDIGMILALLVLLAVAVLAGLIVGYGVWSRRKANCDGRDDGPLALLDALQDHPVVSGGLVTEKCVRLTPNEPAKGRAESASSD